MARMAPRKLADIGPLTSCSLLPGGSGKILRRGLATVAERHGLVIATGQGGSRPTRFLNGLSIEWATLSSRSELHMRSSSNTAPAPLGHVVAIGGACASIRLTHAAAAGNEPARITIGNFLGIETDASRVVAVITHVDGSDKAAGEPGTRALMATADLLGEIRTRSSSSAGSPVIP
jgi:hypothetical protein